MTPESALQKVRDELSSLRKDDRLSPFHRLLENLVQIASAEMQPYPPEIYEGLIELVRRMSADVQQGHHVQDLVEQAISGAYIQRDWKVHDVYNTNGGIFQFFLGKIRDEIQTEEPDKGILLPVVLLVMKAEEANDLKSGAAFQGQLDESGLRADFQILQSLLESSGVNDWAARYCEDPKAWQPFSSAPGTDNIEQLICRALDLVEGYQKPLIPEFVDIRTLNDEQHRARLRKLRTAGCVVIIDVISMRHPVIQRGFHESFLGAFPHTLVVKVAPTYDVLQVVQQMVMVFERNVDLEFERRLRLDLDQWCAQVWETEWYRFGGMLKNMVPNLVIDESRAQGGVRKYQFGNLTHP